MKERGHRILRLVGMDYVRLWGSHTGVSVKELG